MGCQPDRFTAGGLVVTGTKAIRAALIGVGLLLMGRGAWLAVTTIPRVDRIHVAIWFALGVVLHDGLIAPVSVLLGRLALPALPVSARWGARALLAWVATVLVIGLPLVHQAPVRENPTVEIGHPLTGLYVAMALGVAVVAAVQIVQSVRRARGGSNAPAQDAGGSVTS
jgi:hypothetical protein